MPSSDARLAGLVGAGVASSLTPYAHMAEGRAQGIDYVFTHIDLTDLRLGVERLPEILDWAERLGFDGLNVTHPCKQAVIDHLDRLDPLAEAIGAVNTVLFTPEGRVGRNTDTTGFEAAFRTGMAGAAIERVVLLGAGGAGSAVADAVLRLGARRLDIVDLDEGRAALLAERLSARHGAAEAAAAGTPGAASAAPGDGIAVGGAAVGELPRLLAAADGVVHCTPRGMRDHPGAPFDPALLRPDLWVADIVYRPIDTELLREARSRGCRVLDGGGMAVFQAVEAFRLITGREADPERMTQHFRRLLDEERAPHH
ncbi:MAG: shikimate dehydrogenase [Leucobacter sp.]